MLRYAAVFFVGALAAAIFGVLGNATAAVSVARLLFYVFLTLFLVSLVSGLVQRNRTMNAIDGVGRSPKYYEWSPGSGAADQEPVADGPTRRHFGAGDRNRTHT